MTVPEEFDGSDDNPSPEDLFSASIMTCVVATFKSIAERKNLKYSEISAEAEGVLGRGEDTRPIIKEAEIQVQVTGVEDEKEAENVADATRKNCFIHNSVKTDVTTSFEFR